MEMVYAVVPGPAAVLYTSVMLRSTALFYLMIVEMRGVEGAGAWLSGMQMTSHIYCRTPYSSTD